MYSIIAIVITLFTSLTFAAPSLVYPYPGLGMCSLSTHSDSYGRGLESAFTGEDLRHQYNDEACYQLGFNYAQGVIEEEGRSWCERDFERAYAEGFKSSTLGAGSACYVLGYTAGRAALGVGAREGKVEMVGQRCVSAYKSGVKDGKAGRVSNARTTSQPELFCYQLGHFEFNLFE